VADTLIGSDLPEQLEEALLEFRSRVVDLARVSQSRGSHYAVHHFLETASDVEAAGRLLASAQRSAAETLEETASMLAHVSPQASKWVIPSESPELETLRIAWKSWFFYVRAFCDPAYRLILADLQGMRAARRGAMSAIVNPANPVALLLSAEAPDVIPWFMSFRARRNEVKDGVNFGFTALASPGVAITFNLFSISPETGRPTLHIGADFKRESSHLGADDERELPFSTVVDDVRQLNSLLVAGTIATRR
jgi:hypothetical protein